MKWNLNFTTTKVLSFLILFSGVWLALKLDDSKIILEAFLYATITQGVRNMPEIVKYFKGGSNAK